jgi:hypothetical protein
MANIEEAIRHRNITLQQAEGCDRRLIAPPISAIIGFTFPGDPITEVGFFSKVNTHFQK